MNLNPQSNCTACPLHESALTVCIGGRGPKQAKVLIVGQNPDREADFAGEPFAGKYGKLLNGMLVDAGFDPALVRVTYAARCATPDNRVPFPAEVLACSTHLREEIHACRPEAIIALGEVALKTLVGNKAISSARGQSFPLHPRWEYDCDVFVTYAPGYVLKSPMARSTVVSDLRRVRDRGLVRVEQVWRPWQPSNWGFSPRTSPHGLVLAYDIETYDREGKITDAMTQAAISDGERAYVTISHTERMLREARKWFTIVGHNSWLFDDLKSGIVSDYDTQELFRLIDETQPLGLESLTVKYLGARGWKEDRGANLGTAELAEYNARDAVMTARLFHKGVELLGERMKIMDIILRPARKALSAASRFGVWIDPKEVAKARAATEILLEQRRALVEKLAYEHGFPEGFFDKQLKTKVKRVPFNPGSNDHVGAVLEFLGFTLPLTRQAKPRVDKEVLVYIAHPFADAVLEFRETAKRMSTYIERYEQITQTGDGRVHTTYKTLNSRSSSSDPNTQNLDRELKKFKAPAPGKVLVSCDYATVEFRMGAFIADERVIIENYNKNPKWDAHTWFACRLYDKSEEEVKAEHASNTTGDSMRQIAKSANFSQEYLGTGETLRNYAAREMGVFLTRTQSEHAHKGWHKAFPGWAPFYDRTKQELLANGYVESLTGRRRNFGDISLLNRQQLLEALREAVNFKIQSFCYDLALLALGEAHRRMLPLCDFVHDDLKFEFDSMEDAKAAEQSIRECMIDVPLAILKEHWGIVPTVPLEVEFTYQVSEQLPSVEQVA